MQNNRSCDDSACTIPIAGIEVVDLTQHPDHRGVFTEIYRESWFGKDTPVQWNVVHSMAGVLRGVHVHRRHSDYLTLAAGRLTLGVCDLRRSSPTYRQAATLSLTPARAVSIPPGVAHGFYFEEPSIHVYAVTHYWDLHDELGCHWSDSELTIPWSVQNPIVSDRDNRLPSLSSLLEQLA